MENDYPSYLEAMGIQSWKTRTLEKSCEAFPEMSSDWNGLQQQTEQCTRCELHKTRKNAVFGVGDPRADLLIIGEAPGANEDLQGEPFVGRAGMLLNSMLKAIGLERQTIYIANILKCRPPNNRDPLPHEVECCTPFLKKQIEIIGPKLMVAVGRIAAQFLLNTKEPMSKLRGKHYEYNQVPLLVTFHPAYLLRSPREKARAYDDLKMISTMLSTLATSKGE